jgi:hypothetical protein
MLKMSKGAVGMIYKALVIGLFCLWSPVAFAQGESLSNDLAEEEEQASTQEEEPRKFQDVLMDLLNEFAFDMKSGLLKGLPNTSLRRVTVSETVPKSYETYLESLTAERLRKFASVKVIQCAPCRTKRSYVEKGRLVVSSPLNNPAELDKLAELLRIETWTDVALLYQESGMLLAFNVFDAKTKELLWTKIYNSETLYRKVLKAKPTVTDVAGVDGSSDGKENKEKENEKATEYVGSFTLGYMLIPNVKKSSNMLGAMIRLAERFNEGKSEIGASIMPVIDPGVVLKNYNGVEGDPSASGEVTVAGKKETVKPFRVGGALFANYHHNFYSFPENHDALRMSGHFSAGGFMAQGYLTFTGRVGPTFKFGRRFVLESGLMYSAPTTLTIKDTFTYKTKGGIGADVTFGLGF